MSVAGRGDNDVHLAGSDPGQAGVDDVTGTGFDRDPRALPQLVAAAGQVSGLGGVARQLDGFVVRRA